MNIQKDVALGHRRKRVPSVEMAISQEIGLIFEQLSIGCLNKMVLKIYDFTLK